MMNDANTSTSFIYLVSHRFASHCCEALFLRAAPTVTEELLAPSSKDQMETNPQADDDNPVASMESLYLQTLTELKENLGYLLTDRYASHVLRILLLVLSGEPIDTASTKHLLQSKRKETNAVAGARFANVQSLDKKRSVPDSFSEALEKIISDSIVGLDTEKLRGLALHPNGNPTLQLLLRLELSHFGKKRAKSETSIIRTLLPDDPITTDSGSAVFINSMVYDQVGSHLVERIIESAPGKMFKTLYAQFFKDKLATLARNETAGFVVCRILERLGHDNLLEAHEILVPTLTSLLQKGRTMVVRTLIERCTVRDIDTQAIAVQIDATWHGPDGFEVRKLLKFGKGEKTDTGTPHDSVQGSATETPKDVFSRSAEPLKTHFNILAQAMLLVPGSLSSLVLDSLVTLDPDTLLNMSRDHIVSRTIQAALTSRNASMITTRKLIQHFYGHMGEMAVDTAASHVVDCIWEGTHGLAFIRERIAEELAENEAQLRNSSCGRAVWKNWKMDLYKRRRQDWVRQSKIKASNDGFQSFSELDANKDQNGKAKTPLELARERHARGRKQREWRKSGSSSRRPGAPTASTNSTTTAST
jgi:nucleolar protein 9